MEFPPVHRARVPGERFHVLTLSRLDDRKGHDVLLDALVELRGRAD